MIDLSDDLYSEVKNICFESNVGAVIWKSKIPISKNTAIDSKTVKKNPIDLALYGGEDYELLFTAGKDKLNQLLKLDVTLIGEIVSKPSIKIIKK